MTVPPKVLLCDLDGVVWLAHQPIPGSVDALKRAREAGMRVVFVTNNSRSTLQEQVDGLASIGVLAAGDVLTSSMATARLIQPGWRVLVSGGAGLIEAVMSRDAIAVPAYAQANPDERFDAVVVGMHFEFDYACLRRASSAIRAGAMFIASNTDATYPTSTGEIPGGGAIVAAIEKASGVKPVVAGKPHAPMAEAVFEMTGVTDPSLMMMVGDRAETDGAFARTLGCRYALVLSGVTQSSEDVDADLVGVNLAEVVDMVLK